MNLILSWALGIDRCFSIRALCSEKVETLQKSSRGKHYSTSLALEPPSPVFWLWHVSPSYPFCPSTATMRCHLDRSSLNGICTPAFSWRASFLSYADGWVLNSPLELPSP